MYVIKGEVSGQVGYYVGTKLTKLWGSEWEVRCCSETINGATHYTSIKAAEQACEKLIPDKFKIYPVCPRCHMDYSEPPAISRRDNKTKICAKCGVDEALLAFKKANQTNK